MLPKLVYKYIYNDDIKNKLAFVLRKKVKSFFPKTHYDEVRKYYLYIIDLVYNNYKNKVIINKKEFKKLLEEKYEIYFKETINNMSSNKQVSIQKNVNSSLSFYAKSTKYLHEKIYVDKDKKEKEIGNNLFLMH